MGPSPAPALSSGVWQARLRQSPDTYRAGPWLAPKALRGFSTCGNGTRPSRPRFPNHPNLCFLPGSLHSVTASGTLVLVYYFKGSKPSFEPREFNPHITEGGFGK